MGALHPMLAPWATALLLAAILAEATFLVTKRETFSAVAFWNLILGSVLALAALAAGWRALESLLADSAATALLALHRAIGIAAAIVFVLLAAWRLVLRGRPLARGRTLYLALAFTGAAALLSTTVLGHVAVFQHGAGVTLHTTAEKR